MYSDYVKLVLLIAVLFGIVAALEWFLVYHHTPNIMPEKSFEIRRGI